MIDEGVGLESVRLRPYDLPLSRPWRTARGVLRRRQGWLVELVDADGGCGLGECAPMPEAGTESRSLAEENLRYWTGKASGMTVRDLWDRIDAESPTPAARCALESAILDLVSRRREVPVARLLNATASSEVEVNASVGIADAGLAQRSEDASRRGFRVLKVKLGTAGADEERAAIREAMAAVPPGVQLRLDANGVWNLAEARDWLAWLADQPIESLEEPLGDADPDTLKDLQKAVSWPLALDESLPRLLAECGKDNPPVRRIVIKPMAVGGPRPAMRLAAAFRGQCVVTTTVDAAPGRWIAAQLAAALNTGLAHGLDTGGWLAEDVGRGPIVHHGRCRVF